MPQCRRTCTRFFETILIRRSCEMASRCRITRRGLTSTLENTRNTVNKPRLPSNLLLMSSIHSFSLSSRFLTFLLVSSIRTRSSALPSSCLIFFFRFLVGLHFHGCSRISSSGGLGGAGTPPGSQMELPVGFTSLPGPQTSAKNGSTRSGPFA